MSKWYLVQSEFWPVIPTEKFQGGVDGLLCFCYYLTWDDALFSMGNYFQTLEEAGLSAKAKLAEQRVLRKIAELNAEQNWEPDWNNGEQFKYSVEYNYSTNRFSTTHRRTMHCYSLGLVGSDKTIKWVMDNMESDLRTMFMLGEVQ